MFRGFSLSILVTLLLSCAGFGAVGQAHGHTLAGPGSAATVGCCQSACFYYHCTMVGVRHQTWIVGCHHGVMCWFGCWPCRPRCQPPADAQCISEGGDAIAVATAIGYGGDATAIAEAIGGDATATIAWQPASDPLCVARGGDATASAGAVSYGGTAYASAHAKGGDAVSGIN